MKILITSDWYEPTINGVVTSVINLKRQLEAHGHEVRVLTLAQNGGRRRLLLEGGRQDNVWYLPSIGAGKIYPGARAVWGFGRSFLREMIAWHPDVVHSQCEFTTFWFASRIVRATGAKFLHTYHTVYEDYTHYFSPNRRVGKKAAAIFSRQICGQTDGVIVPTEKVRSLLQSYQVSCLTYTVPSGIACETFAEAHRAHRDEMTMAERQRTLISVGRLAKEKNTEELLHWLASGRGQQYRMVIVGDGPQRKTLEELAERLELTPRVQFAGMVEPQEVADWYQKGGIFVSASRSETQGLTYLEALASGLPAVCRRDDCLADVVVDGVNGWQYENRDEFFEALERLADEETYRRISQQALESARSFDRALFAERILKVYEEQLYKPSAGYWTARESA